MQAFVKILFVAAGLATISSLPAAPVPPDLDQRGGPVKTLNTLRAFPEIQTRAEAYARKIAPSLFD